MSVVNILAVVHVAFAALWFGAPLMMGSTLKKARPHGQAAFHAAAGVAHRMATLASVGILGVIATGVGLIFLKYGGMKGLPVRFHIALGLALLATGVGFGLLKSTAGKLVSAAAAEGFQPDSATASIKKLSMGTGINHLLWLICLVLMFAY
jgi:putative copper export protein